MRSSPRLARGDRVELRGFGAFSVKHRPGARRPQSAHRRPCAGRPEERAVFQDRQGNARTAEPRARGSRRRARLRPYLGSARFTAREVMRKFFTALIVIPLGLIFIVFAVANRHLVTVSFDPFNSRDPSVGVTLPLFVVIIARGDPGRGGGRHRDLVPAAPLAARGAAARGRCAAGAGATGRSARQRMRPRGAIRSASWRCPRRAPDMGPAGETSRARRCRTRPNRPAFSDLLSLP